ncbi:TcpE family conjugal transfer membrane protein [Nocardiopsis sp. ATB16-24]|uniref:TcpE family conjugal transfer membrane protein n=1 Tax=Nocardiopsis sp. ATB16-24 TaxID=3019555 RepID=UPI002555C9C3|nr:TcpE family conjugal transfer membrane protein [Nocardiopsis sp. ATB16-24]
MDLPTYTNIWRIEKRLYKLYDFRLPMPLPVGTFGVALGVFTLWVILLGILNAPFVFGNGWHLVLWVVPPGVITVLATRPVVEGKRLTELLISQARFLTEARVYTRLAPEYEPAEVRVAVRVWHRSPQAGPLPLVKRRRTAEEPAAETTEVPVQDVDVRPSRADAPPLSGVAARAEPTETVTRADTERDETAEEPVTARVPGGLERVPERAGESAPRTSVRKTPDGTVDVSAAPARGSVAVVSPSGGEQRRASVRPGQEGEPDGPSASGTEPRSSEGPRRGVGRRVLDYFGIGFETDPHPSPEEPGEPREHGGRERGRGDPGDDPPGDFDDFEAERVHQSESEEQRDSDEWFASLRASSGQTPVGLTSKSAYSVGDTTALSREEVADAVAGRAPDTAQARDPEEETHAARRLRGRTQGLRVTRDLEERRSERARERERGPDERRTVRARAQGLPDTGDVQDRPRRKDRPHAAPWELEKDGRRADPSGPADVSDYAARYAAATGRPAAETAVPWLPPASATPEEEPRERVEEGTEVGHETEVRTGKPPLELDHGTGEQDALPARPREETDDRGPEWNERMSVLDQHLSTADTPAPPRPTFADAAPGVEGDARDKDAAPWFEDGKKRHPDQPKVGDRGNPVIPAGELREESVTAPEPVSEGRGPEERAPAPGRAEREPGSVPPVVRNEGAKPPIQLDHGTGELAGFREVRDDAGHGDVNVRADSGDVPVRRRTFSDLEEAEAAALARRRQAALGDTSGGARPASGDGGERGGGEARGEAQEREESPEQEARQDGDLHDGDLHDGVFHRVAQNARRLGRLFGQPTSEEEPTPSARETKPELELDHGTGEQERLGDTPHGVPSQRAEAPVPPRQEEATGDSGGTRGWRRLAKVVTGGTTAPVRSDLPASDIERLRTALDGPRNLVVLGCTGGAGQTVTTVMIGHTLAAHRDDLVVAVDTNPGPNGLSRRAGAQSPETLTGLLANAEAIRDYSDMSGYTSRTTTGLEVVQTLDDPYVQTLDERDYGQLTSLLGGFYGITLVDPAATGVARALPAADGLVLVAPANADAERAVSMTFDWLDGNGYGVLRARSVLVVNGVSKRSLQAVDAAERVARGRCRAIVRIPWDDHLGSSYTRIDVGALRPATKRAHGALGGVLVHSLTQ